MAKAIDPEDIKRVLTNPGFLEVIERTKTALTRKVMETAKTDEDRAEALTDYRAITRIMLELRKAAQIEDT